jgi:hypothetical protein
MAPRRHAASTTRCTRTMGDSIRVLTTTVEATEFTGPQYQQRACNRTPANKRVTWRNGHSSAHGANCSTQRTPRTAL